MTPILPIRLMSRKIVPKQDSIGLSHDYGELYYSLHGVMELMIDGQHYIAPKHHCIWLPPNTWHYCTCQNEVHFLTLHIDPIWAKALSDKVCVLTVSSLMQSVLGYLHNQPQDRLDIPSNQRLLQVAYDQLLQASSSDNYLPGSNDPMIAPFLIYSIPTLLMINH
ncbi:AraC family ligand binding domain-containing protein [Orbus wheelerorum]|uniref:AraC family ligand binding domain-containing protein n=1 Tax=Orbus wheelerorum TaxID=3074111 RepID=UPI00370DB6A5